MNITRRGLFKILTGAFVAAKAAPLLPGPPLNIATLIEKRMEDAYAEMGRQLTNTIFLCGSPLEDFKLHWGEPVYFDDGTKITQSLMYGIKIPNPRHCAVIKNLG